MTDKPEDTGAAAERIIQLLGKRVTVTNPDLPSASWTGVLTGRYDEPVLTLEMADGSDRALPQRFDIAEAGPDDDEVLARYAAELPGMPPEACENCRAQSALDEMRAALRCVLLPWMESQDDTMTARRLRTTLEAGMDEVEDLIKFASQLDPKRLGPRFGQERVIRNHLHSERHRAFRLSRCDPGTRASRREAHRPAA